MPRKAVNYLNTIIYKIVCKDLSITDVYVGQTTNYTKRKNQHKRNCCNLDYKKHNLKVYQYIRENGGWENFDMIEIEKYPCNDANEARKRERFWFEELNAKLNQVYPSRTKQEYYNDNREIHQLKTKNIKKIISKNSRYVKRNIIMITRKQY